MGNFGKGDHLLLVDGSGYIFRAYFSSLNVGSNRFLYRSDGTPVGALHIFCNMVITDVLQSSRNPTHQAIVFDHSSHSFRNDFFPEYKANRPPPPEDLVPQFASSRTATRAFNIPCLELEGYEADDIIATLAKRAQDAGGEVSIISSDKDLMQLVGDGISMYDPKKKEVIGREQVYKKFSVYPEQVVDVQALMGDSTDNIQGVPGVGPKTAANLINEFGSLDALLGNLNGIKREKLRDSIKNSADQIPIYKRLVLLEQNVPMDWTLNDLKKNDPEPEPLFEFLAQQEFRSLVRRAADYLNVSAPDSASKETQTGGSGKGLSAGSLEFKSTTTKILHTKGDIQTLIKRIYDRGQIAFSFEVDDPLESHSKLVGFGCAITPQETYYLPLINSPEHFGLFDQPREGDPEFSTKEALFLLQPVFEDSSLRKIGSNIKFLGKLLLRDGILLRAIEDVQLMQFAIEFGNHKFDLDQIAESQLGFRPPKRQELLKDTSGKKIGFDQLPIVEASKISAVTADILLRLWILNQSLLSEKKVTKVYETLDKPLIEILAKVEEKGILVDPVFLQNLSSEFAEQLKNLETKIHSEAGEDFNIASPKQLGVILFEKLQLPVGKAKTSSGYKTGVDVLEELAVDHSFPRLILEWRHLAKLKSTYTDSLVKSIHPETGRVHTSYRLDGANTGRLSSINPNLQNIPIRTAEGKRIREAFYAKDGHVLVSLDYSQIELRILAYMAKVRGMTEAFNENLDIHLSTASEMFDVPLEDVTPDLRRQAKAINFGIIYGISAFGLARNLQIERNQASEFIKGYFIRYPEIKNYMDSIVGIAKSRKYVTTLFGRKIGTPKIDIKGPMAAFAKRAAINAPIQGSAADIIRRAMIRVPKAIEKLPAHLLLQIHDELLFEVRSDAVEDLISVAKQCMEGADLPAVKIQPRLVVDAGQGKNWSEAH